MRWKSERSFGNTEIVLDIPDEWQISRDMSLKNWPYKLVAPGGTTLRLWISKDVWVQRAGWQPPLPTSLEPDAQRTAYSLAERPGRELRPLRCGSFSGFVYALDGASPGWEGFLVSQPWMLHPRLELAGATQPQDESAATAILASTTFRELPKE